MKRAIKRSKLVSSKGSSLIIVLLIALIITAGIFFTNGLFTDTNKPPLDLTAYTPVAKNFDDNRVVLQLKTINFESCGDTAALGFLVDQSGSMNYGTKEENLKNALNVFATNFPSGGVTGLTTFSDSSHSLPGIYFVPFNLFKNSKTQFINVVGNMTADGGTNTKDAFLFEQQILNTAKAKYPENKFNLVFISDGIPETREGNNCGPSGPGPAYCGVHPPPDGSCRCFDANQDPTTVATEIKNSNIRIFTIAYIHDESEQKFRTLLQTLMKNVASSTSDYYEAPADNKITGILQQIVTKVCKAQP